MIQDYVAIVIAVVSSLVAVNVEAQDAWTPITANAPSEDRAFDARFSEAGKSALEHLREARLDIGTPALSAAAAVRGELVWAGVVGFADLETQTAATLSTKFRIGSTSKALTATGLARLFDDGLINLDSPIGEYAPELPNTKWSSFTCRQLASHTAGLPGYEKNTDFAGLMQTLRLDRQYDDVVEALEIFDGSKLLFEAGTDFHYSSFDVNLLSVVMQSVAKQPYLELMQTRVFDPFGMRSTHADYQDRPVENRATFYDRREKKVKRWKDVNLSQKWASGGFVSTPSDLIRLGSSYFDNEFINSETVDHFWAPQRLTNGEENVQHYAIGWRSYPTGRIFGEDRPVHAVHHGGVSKGSMSWLVIYPEYQLVVAININTLAETFQQFSGQETAISQIFLGQMERLGLMG